VTLILRDTLIGALENVIHAIQFPRFPRKRIRERLALAAKLVIGTTSEAASTEAQLTLECPNKSPRRFYRILRRIAFLPRSSTHN